MTGSAAIQEIEEAVLVAAVTGDHAAVASGAELARSLIPVWEGLGAFSEQSLQEWLDLLLDEASDPAHIADVVEGQVTFHKLSKIRVDLS